MLNSLQVCEKFNGQVVKQANKKALTITPMLLFYQNKIR